MSSLSNEISMDILQFDSLCILVHMYHLISMHYPVIQSVITGLKSCSETHIRTHTQIPICMYVNMVLWGFFTCMCLAVCYVTGSGEMFLAPSAKDEGMTVVISYFLSKDLTNFVTTFGDVLHTIRLNPFLKRISL